jgi:hypothetical protein
MIDFVVNVVFNQCMSTQTDAELIASLGGPTKVAELLGLPKFGGAQRVQNWLYRGIPSLVKVQRPDLFMQQSLSLPHPVSQEK